MSLKQAMLFILIIILALLLRFHLIAKIKGFFQGDPVEYSNMAIHIAHRKHLETWSIRSYFYPLILSLPLFFFKGEGDALVFLLRTYQVFLSLIVILTCFILGEKVENKNVGLVASFFLGLNPVFVKWSISTVPCILTAFFLLLSLLFFLSKRYRASGIFLGFALITRYQAIIFFIPLALLLVLSKRIRELANFIIGFFVILCFQGLLDYFTYGKLFESSLSFFHLIFLTNYATEIAKIGGVSHDANWYALHFSEWFTAPLVLLIILSLIHIIKRKHKKLLVISFVALFSFILLSLTPIKQARYLVPLIPFFSILSAYGLNLIGRKNGKAIAFSFLLLISIFSVYHSLTINPPATSGFVEGAKYIAKLVNERNENITLATVKWATGGLYYLPEEVKVIDIDPFFWKNESIIKKAVEEADFVLIWKQYNNMSILYKFRNFTKVKDYGNVILLENFKSHSP